MTAATGDVTAVVLTMGEPTTARALASLDRQTVPPAAVTIVRGVTPFHRALNQGAGGVATPFFVQVDADMALDATCIEALRHVLVAHPRASAAMGFLRDPLIGRVSSVKLFRRACFDIAAIPDSITPDTDFFRTLRDHGWVDLYALRFDGPREQWHTFGEHQPAYTPAYTWSKHLLEGARYRFRGDADGVRWHLGVLAASAHPSAPIARIALANGIFETGARDGLKPFEPVPALDGVHAFLHGNGEARTGSSRLRLLRALDARRLFLDYRRLGASLRHRRAGRAFRRCLDGLAARTDPFAWVAQVALCRGSTAADGVDDGAAARDWAVLAPLLPRVPRRRLVRDKIAEAVTRRMRRG